MFCVKHIEMEDSIDIFRFILFSRSRHLLVVMCFCFHEIAVKVI